MTSVYRLADETEEFRFIPSKNYKITAIENIRKRKHPSRKEEHKREQPPFKSDNVIWETQ